MKQDEINLEINPALARKILTGFIRSETSRVGFERAVVGLSGGVDSSLTCALAAEALGPENVMAVRMPYTTSSPDSLEHAGLVIEMTGVQEVTLPISEAADALIGAIPEDQQVRRGNIMARMRMIVLYDQSAEFHGLVIGTGNKTEKLLGYTTQFGDAASAISPLGDLYKTQVRPLAVEMGVPEVILEKPPSADLWIGQTDEGELGFTYEEVDKLLYLLVDRRHSPDDCVDAGFDRGFVENVSELMRRNHFKRVMPPIAKLSNRTIGYDFLYMRDWGT
ncbi:MAG: NAD+ synthase [Chloroflexi bacterium]|nr:NAD+ synthase [Chloroflexota bacterium]